MANHLQFEFAETRFAIAAEPIDAIHWLPALAAGQDLPAYFVGLMNLHGEILPVVDLAAATKFPQDVVGLHFFNPAQIMKLVEVVSTVATAEDVVATAVDVCRRLDKHPVTCGDRAGFIVNALLFPYLNDAVKMLEANYASADDIDTAMKTGCGYPMGPFELLDVVGLDVSLAIERTLYLEFREPGFAPAPRLEHLVTAGYLGRKSGRGFRSYDA